MSDLVAGGLDKDAALVTASVDTGPEVSSPAEISRRLVGEVDAARRAFEEVLRDPNRGDDEGISAMQLWRGAQARAFATFASLRVPILPGVDTLCRLWANPNDTEEVIEARANLTRHVIVVLSAIGGRPFVLETTSPQGRRRFEPLRTARQTDEMGETFRLSAYGHYILGVVEGDNPLWFGPNDLEETTIVSPNGVYVRQEPAVRIHSNIRDMALTIGQGLLKGDGDIYGLMAAISSLGEEMAESVGRKILAHLRKEIRTTKDANYRARLDHATATVARWIERP